jgi:hypothetical protein
VAAVLLLAAAGAAMLAACGEQPPPASGAPDITGPVATVTAADDGTTVAAFLIDRGSGAFDKASVSVGEDTEWYRDTEGTAESIDPPSVDELRGKRVDVQFAGAVAESYPVQGTAAWVVVHE